MNTTEQIAWLLVVGEAACLVACWRWFIIRIVETQDDHGKRIAALEDQ